MDTLRQIETLETARLILRRAATDCVDSSQAVFNYPHHAMGHIDKQIEELLRDDGERPPWEDKR